ncbi:MAG: hypothetical protein IID57_04740 [Proteobacteria bacterium]|nr:hypothetical protein [Pseudomonadota bacterium]
MPQCAPALAERRFVQRSRDFRFADLRHIDYFHTIINVGQPNPVAGLYFLGQRRVFVSVDGFNRRAGCG